MNFFFISFFFWFDSTTSANTITWNKSKFGAVFEEDVSRGLRWIYANSIVGDDRTRCRILFELKKEEKNLPKKSTTKNIKTKAKKINSNLFGCVFQHGGKWRILSSKYTHTLKGNFGSEVSVILKVTFDDEGATEVELDLDFLANKIKTENNH